MNMTSTVIATRGERLTLGRFLISAAMTKGPNAFHTDVLGIVEINADNRIVACVMFDVDDINAAFEELDARTSPAKRPPTRDLGRSSQGSTPGSTGTKSPRRRRTG